MGFKINFSKLSPRLRMLFGVQCLLTASLLIYRVSAGSSGNLTASGDAVLSATEQPPSKK